MTDQTTYRTPIVAVLGHVDHGKTTLLDEIRESAVTSEESGSITQHIGATTVPLESISATADVLVEKDDFDLPGLLFIDTPGHYAFSSLRSRGGALADIAILVVDIDDGIQPQTEEAISILRETQTPFVVDANKVDRLPGWCSNTEQPIQKTLGDQNDRVKSLFNKKIYELIGEFSDYDVASDLFWQVNNFQRTVGVVPTSAETGEGVGDLLTVLMGLAQQYLKNHIAIDVRRPAEGTVIDINKQKGFGTTIDVLIHDGTLKSDDTVILGSRDGLTETDVRKLLKPKPLEDTRSTTEFRPVDSVSAASGVRVVAPSAEAVVAGAPLRGIGGSNKLNDAYKAVREELEDVAVTTDTDGIVAKADTLGSLEALVSTLRDQGIEVMRAEVGDVSPRDVSIASTAGDVTKQVVLGFNVDILQDATDQSDDQNVCIFTHDIIYRLLDNYENYVSDTEATNREDKLDDMIRPARIRVLGDHVFNRQEPAIVGIEVLAGRLKKGTPFVRRQGNKDVFVGYVSRMENRVEAVDMASEGDRVSVSIKEAAIGRDFSEGDTLWARVPEEHAILLETEFSNNLTTGEKEALDNYVKRKRKSNPFWGK